jgi:hypothetical protein
MWLRDWVLRWERLKKFYTFLDVISVLGFKFNICTIKTCKENTSILIGLQLRVPWPNSTKLTYCRNSKSYFNAARPMRENKGKQLFSEKTKFGKHPSHNFW